MEILKALIEQADERLEIMRKMVEAGRKLLKEGVSDG